jgi:hypothetical protein
MNSAYGAVIVDARTVSSAREPVVLAVLATVVFASQDRQLRGRIAVTVNRH